MDVEKGTDDGEWKFDVVIGENDGELEAVFPYPSLFLAGCECVFDGIDSDKTAATIRQLFSNDEDCAGTVLIAGIEEGRLQGGWKGFDDAMESQGMTLTNIKKIFDDKEFIVRKYKTSVS